MRVSPIAPAATQLGLFANISSFSVDYILIIKADVNHTPNPNEVQDSKFISKNELKTMMKNETLKFTPWFKLICETLLYKWWEDLDGGLDKYTGEKDIRRM